MGVKWSRRLENWIREYADHDNMLLRRLEQHRPVIERATPPNGKEAEAMTKTLTSVFSTAGKSSGPELYVLICAEMKLPYSYEPETYYNNLERMAAFAGENGSTAGKGFRFTAPMGRATARGILRALGRVAN